MDGGNAGAWRRFPQCLRVAPLYGAQDCFCTLPAPTVDLINRAFGQEAPPIVVVEVASAPPDQAAAAGDDAPVQCFVAWSGYANSSQSGATNTDIGLPVPLMRTLGLRARQEVWVRPVANVRRSTQVHVVPNSVDDSEIVEHNATRLEELVLRQLRCAYAGMVCPIYVRPGLHVVIRCERVDPVPEPPGSGLRGYHPRSVGGGEAIEVVTLCEGTELVVATQMRKRPEEGEGGEPAPLPVSLRVESVGAAAAAQLRIHPDTLHRGKWKDGAVAPSVSLTQLCNIAWDARKKAADGKQQQQQQQQQQQAPAVAVAVTGGTLPAAAVRRAVRSVTLRADPAVLPGRCRCLGLDDPGLRVGAVVLLDSALSERAARAAPDEEHPADAPAEPAVGGAAADAGRAEWVRAVQGGLWRTAVAHLQLLGAAPPAAAAFCSPAAAAEVGSRGGLLVTGSGGTGKSTFLAALAADSPVYSVLVRCRPLARPKGEGKSGGSTAALDALRKAAAEAAANAPALLLLDDIDALMPVAGEQAAHDPNASMLITQFAALADRFSAAQLGSHAAGAHGEAPRQEPVPMGVTVVATAASAERVHPTVLHHAAIFADTLSLPLPDGKQRRQILKLQLQSRGAEAPPAACSQAARQTDNYTPADMATLATKAVHHATLRCRRRPGSESGAGALQLEWDDFAKALDEFKPSALHGISMFKPTDHSWEDLGGLEEVKKAIMETIILPTKYPELFAKVPVKLRSGVLLYGPPGCGKSHVVSCAVAEAKINCISVSGPELLNKYIGASEQRVREVFEQAQAAAPSVLFFDEFDAIAPQRGHDNTGVTDRVVNQLLCQLDGVEGRSGVYVIAATSRPDLIDAALLRPGRLDRSALCGMPDAGERKDILRALARKLVTAPDCDWGALAERTEGFSSADLGAVLSTARLRCVQQVVDTTSQLAAMNVGDDAAAAASTGGGGGAQWAAARASDGGAPLPAAVLRELEQEFDAVAAATASATGTPAHTAAAAGVPAITQAALLDALEQTRPSITPSERARWAAIYAKFQQTRGGSARPDTQQRQRVTAA